MPELSIIIPFLNEKEEVENTIESILNHTNDNLIEIIIINDFSDDQFDYSYIQDKYSVTYINNTERLGIAASRDLGVKVAKSPFFLLLDAHMRFYRDDTISIIINELKKNERQILCCQTAKLAKSGNIWNIDINSTKPTEQSSNIQEAMGGCM